MIALFQIIGRKNSGEFSQTFHRFIVNGQQKLLADDKINFFSIFAGQRPFAVAQMANRKMKNQINKILIQIHLGARGGSGELGGRQWVKLILLNHLFQFHLGRRFQIDPGQSVIILLSDHPIDYTI